MDYKLFDEFITLQSLLKTTGILPSGGAIKGFLSDNLLLFNGEKEERRGKKIRIGDTVELPNQGLVINVLAPSPQEIKQHQEDLAEKERVTKMVKEMNKKNKQEKSIAVGKTKKQKKDIPARGPVRFPGT